MQEEYKSDFVRDDAAWVQKEEPVRINYYIPTGKRRGFMEMALGIFCVFCLSGAGVIFLYLAAAIFHGLVN